MAIPAVRAKSEIWAEILEAESRGKAVEVLMKVCDFVQSHADETFVSVERRLRVQNRPTHLVAQSEEERSKEFGELPDAAVVLDPRTHEKRTYIVRVLLSTDAELASKIRQFGANQAENLRRLGDAGLPVIVLR